MPGLMVTLGSSGLVLKVYSFTHCLSMAPGGYSLRVSKMHPKEVDIQTSQKVVTFEHGISQEVTQSDQRKGFSRSSHHLVTDTICKGGGGLEVMKPSQGG